MINAKIFVDDNNFCMLLMAKKYIQKAQLLTEVERPETRGGLLWAEHCTGTHAN